MSLALEIYSRQRGTRDLPKALFLIDSFGGGGVERCMSYVITSLHEKKFQVVVCPYLAEISLPADRLSFHDFPPGIISPALVRSKKKFPPSRLMKAMLRAITFVATVSRSGFSSKSFHEHHDWMGHFVRNYYFSIRALKALIDQEHPEVILAFARNSSLIALMARSFFKLQIPIYCSHRGHLSKRIYYQPNGHVFKFLAKRFFKKADFHTAVSNGIREDVIQNFDVPAQKIATLYNGIDITRAKQLANEPIEDETLLNLFEDSTVLKIVSIGRLSESKDQETLIKAFHKVRDKTNCQLLLVGKGERKDDLQSLALNLGVSELVHFVGWHNNPFKFLKQCDLFVSSSTSEGFSNVLLEAMAFNLPMIATDCEFGPRELLDNGKYGIIVPIKDVNALSEAMLRVLTNEKLRSEMRTLSAKRIQDFQVLDMVKKYEQLLVYGSF